ncbi:hypothetical protein Dimus_011023 [Dionaea muscipula]
MISIGQVVEVMRVAEEEDHQKKETSPVVEKIVPIIVVDDEEEDLDMNVLIKREVSKDASGSSQQDEEDMDAFFDSLPKFDQLSVPPTAPLAPKVQEEESMKEKESAKEQIAETSSVLPTTTAKATLSESTQKITSIEDRGKVLKEIDPLCPPIVQRSATQPSDTFSLRWKLNS